MEQIKIFLYVLELEKGRYYVGQTNKPTFRYAQHISYDGPKWTKFYKAKNRILVKEMMVDSAKEAKLYENWLTLIYMEKMGWQKVRGGDYCKTEDYQLKEDIYHIFDTETNTIRYFVPRVKYLFGTSEDYIIYILELENNKYYIGSTQKLGKCLGKHFLGKGIDWTKFNRPIRVLEYYTVPSPSNYIEEKLKRFKEHIAYYGMENVRGVNLEQRR